MLAAVVVVLFLLSIEIDVDSVRAVRAERVPLSIAWQNIAALAAAAVAACCKHSEVCRCVGLLLYKKKVLFVPMKEEGEEEHI